MKISSLLIGLVIMGAFMIALSNMVGGLNNSYGTNIDESEFTQFSKIEEINNLTSITKTEIDGISNNPNALDKLSSFFNSGIVALKTTFASFDLVTSFVDDGLAIVGLGVFAAAIKAILFVAFFIGVIIAAIIKWRT